MALQLVVPPVVAVGVADVVPAGVPVFVPCPSSLRAPLVSSFGGGGVPLVPELCGLPGDAAAPPSPIFAIHAALSIAAALALSLFLVGRRASVGVQAFLKSCRLAPS